MKDLTAMVMRREQLLKLVRKYPFYSYPCIHSLFNEELLKLQKDIKEYIIAKSH